MTTGAAADLARLEARRVSHRNDVRVSQFVAQKLVTLLLTYAPYVTYLQRV
jgi:hypothetical protein